MRSRSTRTVHRPSMPYRPIIRFLRDDIPIRRRCFPLHTQADMPQIEGTIEWENGMKELRPSSMKICFPLCEERKSCDAQSDRPGQPSCAAPSQTTLKSPIELQSKICAPRSTSLYTDPVSRSKCKIRGEGFMTLFSSTGRRILLSPDNEATSESKDGDLYVHTCALNIQMWARVDGLWKEAYEGLSHPKLSTHCLYRNSKNNRVGWVQKRTVITYNSRNKQQQRISPSF